MYTQNEILDFLKHYYAKNKERYHIKKIGIFGSYAKGKENENSDIDIVVDLEKATMFGLIAIKEDIKEFFKTEVDIVQLRERMNPLLKKRIEKEAIYV